MAELQWESTALRRETAELRQYIAALEETVARIPPLEVRLAQTTYEIGLIRNSRTWRVREALVNVLKFRRRDDAEATIHGEPRPDGQDAPSPATGRHYCEREDHAGN